MADNPTDLLPFTPGVRVRHRHCTTCTDATVVRIADGQVVIDYDDGRRTHVEARDLELV
jgi:hypothetical protein